MSRDFDHIDPGNAGGSVQIPELPKRVSRAPSWACDRCDQTFDVAEKLRVHKLEEHRIKRPSLHINGLANQTDTYRVHHHLSPCDIEFLNTDRVEINGTAQASLNDAAKKICSFGPSKLDLELQYGSFSTKYSLIIEVLAEEEAEAVEKHFIKASTAANCHLAFTDFSNATRGLSFGSRYIAGLQAYLVALMTKDAEPEALLARAEYQLKLGEALDNLEPIRRELAKGIVSIVRFMRNDFRPQEVDSNILFLKDLKSALTEGTFRSEAALKDTKTIAIPLDSATLLLSDFVCIDPSHRERNAKRLEEALHSREFLPIDEDKTRLLLTAWYCHMGRKDLAHRTLGAIRLRPEIGHYAERHYQLMTQRT